MGKLVAGIQQELLEARAELKKMHAARDAKLKEERAAMDAVRAAKNAELKEERAASLLASDRYITEVHLLERTKHDLDV
jgi:hypothetical protein